MTYGGMQVKPHTFLTLALDGGELPASCSLDRRLGRPQIWPVCNDRKIFVAAGNQTQVIQPSYWVSYPGFRCQLVTLNIDSVYLTSWGEETICRSKHGICTDGAAAITNLHSRVEIKIMKVTNDDFQLTYCTIHYMEINEICTFPVTIQHSGIINWEKVMLLSWVKFATIIAVTKHLNVLHKLGMT
jgi:hypothetical protein